MVDTAKLSTMRESLESRKTEIQSELDRLSQEMQWLGVDQANERGGLGNHLGDDGSSVMEQERISTLSGDLTEVMKQIDGALSRMDDGSYGDCQRCGQPINNERLEAFPYVAHCIDCQSYLERQHALHGRR
ncbi:MAG: TraR/DksA family transcriptional regulator [Thermomicrobiales bacterium]